MAAQLSAQIEQSSQGALDQSDRVQGTATAVEEMNATILEVARNASDTAENARQAQDMAHRGAGLAAEVVAAVDAVRGKDTCQASVDRAHRRAGGSVEGLQLQGVNSRTRGKELR